MEKIRPLNSHNSVFPVQDELNERFKLINKNFEILSAVAGQNGGNLDNLVTSVNGQTGDVTIQTGARPNEELTGVVTLNGEPIATQSWVEGKIIPPVRYARATTFVDGLMSADDKRKLDVLDPAQLMNSPSDVRSVNGMKGNVRITAESLGAATRVDPTFTGTVNVPTLDASDGNLRFDNRAASIKFVKQYFVRAGAEITDSLENATNIKAGLMSPEDKSKLDRLPEGGAQSAVVSVNSKTGAVQLEVDDIPGAAPIEEPHFRRAAYVDGKKVATEEMVNNVSARDRGAIKDAIMSDLNSRLVTDNQNGLMDSTSFKKLSDLPDPRRVITRINGIEATGRTNTVTLTPDDIGAVSRANPRMDSEPAIANVRLSDWIRENISVSRITAGLMSPADKRKLDSLSVTQEFSGDMNGRRVTNLGAPESTNDAATKSYVDTAKQGAIDDARRSVEEAKFNLESAIREAKETGADARAEADKANRSVRSLEDKASTAATGISDLKTRMTTLEVRANTPGVVSFDGNMAGKKITNLAVPENDRDGANKAYVDQQREASVETAKSYTDGVKSALEPTIAEAKKAGTDAMERADAAHTQLSGISAKVTALENKPADTFTGDMKGGKISNLADPTAEKDAATMKYVDAEVKKVGVAAATVSSKHAKDLKDELAPQITEAKQVASGASTKVDGIVSRVSTLETDVAGLKAGGGGVGGGGGGAPFTGNMENRKIINLANPETEFDATNKGYVDGIRSELIASVADAKKAGTDARTEADKANTAITDIQSTVSALSGKITTLEGKQIPEAFTGDLKNGKLTNVALPEAATDGATKGYVDTEVAKVDAKISQATAKSGETEGKVSTLEGKASDAAQKIEAAEGKIRTAEGRLDTVEGKVNGLETKVSGLDTAVKELKASGYDDTALKGRVAALESKEDKDTVYDDSGIKTRLAALEAKPGYDDSEVKRRLGEAETAIGAKADSTALASTNSSVSALDARVTNLEAKPDKDTVYDDSDLKRRVSVLEANGGGGGGGAYNDSELRNRIDALEKKEDRDTVYNDAELRGRVQALEAKEDKDTVYNDTELKGRVAAVESAVATKAEASVLQTEAEKITALTTRVKAVEDRPAGGGAAPDLSGYMQKSEFERYFRDSTTSTLEPVYAKKSDISTFINSSALDQAMLGIPRMIGYVRYTDVQAGAWENEASLVPIGTYQRTDVGSLDFSWPALDPKDNLLVILPRQGAYLFQIIPAAKSDTLVYLHDGQGSFDGMVGPISSANAVAMGTGIQFIGAVNGPNKLARIPLATPGNTRKSLGDVVIMITFLGERR